MNTMLSVVVMVFLVATTVGSVKVQEFSENAFLALQLVDPNQYVDAEIINAHHEVQLKIMDRQTDTAAIFKLDPDNASNNDVKLGIKLNCGDEMFFYMSNFGIDLEEEQKGKARISMVLVLVPHNEDPIILEIPVFTAPSKVAPSEVKDPLSWRKWAVEQRVVVFNPMVQTALETAIRTGKIAFNFMWLQELLSYEIYPSKINLQRNKETQTYTTRPIVVSESMKDVLVKIVNTFKSQVGRATSSR